MANIGDLVTSITCDAQGYKPGVDTVVGGNKAIGGSIDAMLGKLERQNKLLSQRPRTTLDNIRERAAEGADAGKVLRAQQLNEQNDALRAKKAAQDAATAAAARGKAAGESLVATVKDELATYNMTTAELRQYRAAQAGASEVDLKAARTTQALIDQRQRLDASLQQSTAAIKGMGNKTMLVTESVRGLEDAVAGFSNNGLKGMLMGVTNNVTQMGALMGGTAGLALSIGAIGGLIGVSLVPKLMDWANGNSKIAEETKKLDEQRQKLHDNEMRRMDELGDKLKRDASDQAAHRRLIDKDPNKKPVSSDLDALQEALKKEQNKIAETQGLGFIEFARQAKMLKDNPLLANGGINTGAGFGQVMVGGVGIGINDGDKQIEAFRKQLIEKQKLQQADFIKSKEAQAKFNDEVKAAQERVNELQLAIARQTAQDKRKQAAQQREEELADAEEQGRKWLDRVKKQADFEKQLRKDLAAQTLDAIRKQSSVTADKIEKQHREEEQRKLVDRALKNGIIKQADADKLNAQIGKTEAMKPGGNAAAVVAGSTEAYSSIIRSMNGARDERFEKQQLDATKELVEIMTKIESKEIVTVQTMAM